MYNYILCQPASKIFWRLCILEHPNGHTVNSLWNPMILKIHNHKDIKLKILHLWLFCLSNCTNCQESFVWRKFRKILFQYFSGLAETESFAKLIILHSKLVYTAVRIILEQTTFRNIAYHLSRCTNCPSRSTMEKGLHKSCYNISAGVLEVGLRDDYFPFSTVQIIV